MKVGDDVTVGRRLTGIVSNSLLRTAMNIPSRLENRVPIGQQMFLADPHGCSLPALLRSMGSHREHGEHGTDVHQDSLEPPITMKGWAKSLADIEPLWEQIRCGREALLAFASTMAMATDTQHDPHFLGSTDRMPENEHPSCQHNGRTSSGIRESGVGPFPP